MKNTPMPRLIYGTAWKKERTADLVEKAVKYGFRGIDTACQPKHYNEKGVGEAIKRLSNSGISREDLYIQTKFTPINGQDPFNIPYNKADPLNAQVAESFEASQKNLGVAYVDGLILHSPLETMERTMAAWRAMEEVHKHGGAKLLGISNCYDIDTLKKLYSEAVIKPQVLQNRFYEETHFDSEIRTWCQEKEITYQSFWTLTANPGLLSSPPVQNAAKTYQKTPPQILFRVLMDIGIVPLTGTCSDQHMKEDLEVLDFDLPKNIVQEVVSLL